MAEERGKAIKSSQMAPGRSKIMSEIASGMFAQRAEGGESSTMAEERAAALQSSTMTAEQAEVVAAERSIDPFEWGDRVEGSSSSYKSMRYRGEWFRVGDCAEFRSGPHHKPYIGKIYRLYAAGGMKMVRVRWFFRAQELPRFCSMDLPEALNPKEVFIGLGNAAGVENENNVATILRKVTVLCYSSHPRNKRPSQDEMEAADYYFNRAYDVPLKKLVLIKKIPDRKNLVQTFFNSG